MAIVRRDERLTAGNLVIAVEIGFLRWVLTKNETGPTFPGPLSLLLCGPRGRFFSHPWALQPKLLVAPTGR